MTIFARYLELTIKRTLSNYTRHNYAKRADMCDLGVIPGFDSAL